MRNCYVTVCFALLATAAGLWVPENFPEHGNQPEASQRSNCQCENGKCFTDNRGNVKCVCKPGHSHQDDFTCKPCDCGKKGKCLFTLSPKSAGGFTYKKKCVCDLGSAEKDGKCIDCYCGDNSACEFHGEEKNCYCIEGYSEKEGICTKCDCGFYGTCTFKNGIKKCDCDEGFLELNGFCEECDCGGNSISCKFSGSEKKCSCLEGFSDKDGTCEVCDCGSNSLGCSFSQGEKKCNCAAGYVQKGKSCEVACGSNHPCQNGGICTDGHCNCHQGTSGEFCNIIDDCNWLCPNKQGISCAFDSSRRQAYCHCSDSKLRYDSERKECHVPCVADEACENGGTCKDTEFDSFCRCNNGTAGDFCEQVPGCKSLSCGAEADCRYDVTVKKAVCQCQDRRLSFDPQDKRCKKPCSERQPCINGGACESTEYERFCRCLDGTAGDLCDRVPGCDRTDCGTEANCLYNSTTKQAGCICLDTSLSFDPRDKTCKNTCQEDRTCKNGAKCRGTSDSKFCECLEGTGGHFCEKVEECASMECGGDADCAYDVPMKKAVCSCRDASKRFDVKTKNCKKICEKDSDCSNGGICSDGFCWCLIGTSGDMCDIVPACYTMDCGPFAKCEYSTSRNSAVCICVDERYSFDEKDQKCKRGCTVDDDCKNSGNCSRRGENKAFCDCLHGTRGDSCEVVDDCEVGRTKCEGDAYCVFDARKLKGVCACSDSRKSYDVVGKECKVTCSENVNCRNGGLCMHRGDELFCECKSGTSGDLCETVDECQRGFCGNGGNVDCLYDVVTEGAVCKCRDSQHLYDPLSKTCKTCDCGKNSISCRLKDGRKVCKCEDGYEATNGICKKVRCTEKVCNNGKCEVVGEKEVCSCYEGYELDGNYCRKLNCTETPCVNGTCVVRHGNREECVCQAGYTLKDGACIRGACRIDTCFGGYCDTIDGELMCICPKNYSLQGIGCFATVCRKQHCFGGWCVVNEDKEEICTCHEGYVLKNDVCKKILCSLPCFGGQCKFVDGKEECICPAGFSMFRGVCRANSVSSKVNHRNAEK